MFYQVSGHLLAQPSQHVKLTTTLTKALPPALQYPQAPHLSGHEDSDSVFSLLAPKLPAAPTPAYAPKHFLLRDSRLLQAKSHLTVEFYFLSTVLCLFGVFFSN